MRDRNVDSFPPFPFLRTRPSFLSMLMPFYSRAILRKGDVGVRNKDGRRERNKGIGRNVKNAKKDMIDGKWKKRREDGRLNGGRTGGGIQ